MKTNRHWKKTLSNVGYFNQVEEVVGVEEDFESMYDPNLLDQHKYD
jgi:hypothetical protein